jgi:methyl-accepting chemotaxis protein
MTLLQRSSMLKFLTGFFRNARISVKVFIAPVAITVFMLAMAAVAQYGSNQQSRALSELVGKTMPKSMAAVEVSDLVVIAHLDLYRTIGWAVNSDDAKKVEESAKRTLASLQRAKQALAAIPQRWALSGEEAAQRDDAAAALDSYAEAATNVAEMAASDAATAFVFLLATEKPFEAVKQPLDRLRSIQARDSEQTSAAAFRTEDQARRLFLMLLAAALVLAMAVTLAVVRMISRPVSGMTRAMTALASGDHSVDIPGTDRGDEIGSMAQAVQVFRKGMIEADRLRGEQEEAAKRAEVEKRAAMRKLADDFEKAVGDIVRSVSTAATELEAAAGTLTKTADVTRELSGSVAAASEQASANVQSVASATEEMSATVQEISRQVRESSVIANQAVAQAGNTNARVSELLQAASRIGDVVKLITAIAEQTNLLALNATIEAARAGDAGRGFAVVAQEVKALAAQTAKATEEIRTQIAGMQSATQESVAAIEEIGGTIGRISEIAATVAAAVEEQGAATDEIARNVQQAAAGTGHVASNIVEVNRGASETGSASAQVLALAQSLAGESTHLKDATQAFIDTVHAA